MNDECLADYKAFRRVARFARTRRRRISTLRLKKKAAGLTRPPMTNRAMY